MTYGDVGDMHPCSPSGYAPAGQHKTHVPSQHSSM